jgi:hypothetical protein
MARLAVSACDVCGTYGVGVTVEEYRIKYPDKKTATLCLCDEHAAPLVKLRESDPAQKRQGAGPKERGKPVIPID